MASVLMRPPTLEGQFDNAIPAEFWHYMAKHRSKRAAYAKQEEIDQRIAGIAKNLGRCSFDEPRGPNQWTPAHVAVLAGNAASLTFLISRQARLDIPDKSGKTAIDLAKEFHPELLPILCPLNKRAIYTEILKPLCTRLDLGPFSYDPNTDDFGVINRTFLFCRDIEPSSDPSALKAIAEEKGIAEHNLHTDLHTDHLTSDMVKIGEYEGFGVEETRHIYYPRDHLARTLEGSLVASTSRNLDKVQRALDREASWSVYFSPNASFRSSHPLFKGTIIGTSAKQKEAFLDCCFKRPKANIKEFRFFMEFGDKFLMTNSQGEKVLVVGEQHLPLIHAYCRLIKLFDEEGIELHIPKDLSNEKVQEIAEEMAALGLLKINGASSFLDYGQISSLMDRAIGQRRTDYKNLAIEMGLLKPFSMNPEEIEAARPLAATYLAQREIVKELLAVSFGLEKGNLVVVPSCGYHLDTMMAPAPNGHMFFYDPATTIAALDGLKAQKGALGLSEQDLDLIDNYRRTAAQMYKELGSLYETAQAALKKAGVPIIKTPGIFFDIPQSRKYPLTSHVHFMNPVTGWSDKTSSYYYITTGTSVGDRLGPVLMDLYAEFLNLHIPGIHVHYVGRNPQNPADFTQAMQLYNTARGNAPQSGIHCHSFPLKTEAHKHKS
ncbi:MAG: ankyrin repeat domain-containing protein [Parachlamydiales bacterium]|nr:ankyrin repeat domain-containing protein [Parachlamydiales bacterium]